MSLGLIIFTLDIAYLFAQPQSVYPSLRRWRLGGVWLAGIFAAMLTHSRSVIVFAVFLLAWKMAGIWPQFSRRGRFLLLVIIALIITLEGVILQQRSILALLLDPYLHSGLLTTIFVLLLTPFAGICFPRATLACLLSIVLLLISLFLPAPPLPVYSHQTLLDRPFVEMILYFPLSFLGGLGVAGMEKMLKKHFAWSRGVSLLAVGLVLLHTRFTFSPYFSTCCLLVGNDDVVALDWMANYLPTRAKIGIAAIPLKVLVGEKSDGDVGADAGVWIAPLTARTTILLPYDSDFTQPTMLEILCRAGMTHLFVGERGHPFNIAALASRPEWYKPLLSMPRTAIYEVIGCDR